MPIEFRCINCKKLLRVKDETAGKQARCPECGTILAIPAKTEAVEQASFAPAASTVAVPSPPGPQQLDESNPYRSAAIDTERVTSGSLASPIQPRRVSYGELMGHTWRVFMANWGMAILLALMLMFVPMVAISLMSVVLFIGAALGVAEVAAVLFVVIYYLAMIWIYVGSTHAFIKLARGDETRFADVFRGGRWFVSSFCAMLLLGLMLWGLMLLMVAAILFAGLRGTAAESIVTVISAVISLYITATFWPCIYLIVDQDMSAFKALSTARRITSGNRITFILALLTIYVLGAIFTVVTVLLGIIVLIPYILIFFAVYYLAITGQPLAEHPRIPSTI